MPRRARSPLQTDPALSCELVGLSGGWIAVLGLNDLEFQFLNRGVHFKHVARFDVASQKFFRQRVFEEFFDCPTHRSSAISRIVTLIDQELDRGGSENH